MAAVERVRSGAAFDRRGGGLIEPREGRWFAEPRPIRRTLRKKPGWYVWLWLPGMLLHSFGSGIAVPFWVRLAEFVGWYFAVVFAIWWFVAEWIALRTTRADRSFSERPAGLGEFPLEVLIRRNGEEVGMDRGLGWFEDGLFCFNGNATSFVLSRDDLVFRRWLRLDLGNEDRGYLRLKGAGRTADIKLLPVGLLNRFSFPFRLRRFRSEPPNLAASRQWPPLLPYGVEQAILKSRSPEEVGAEAATMGSATGVVRG